MELAHPCARPRALRRQHPYPAVISVVAAEAVAREAFLELAFEGLSMVQTSID